MFEATYLQKTCKMTESFKQWLSGFGIECDSSFLTLPASCPLPLKNDWTAGSANRLSVEEEIEKYPKSGNGDTIHPGVLFARINQNKESILLKSDSFSKLYNHFSYCNYTCSDIFPWV